MIHGTSAGVREVKVGNVLVTIGIGLKTPTYGKR
jgi:hypothetical protein